MNKLFALVILAIISSLFGFGAAEAGNKKCGSQTQFQDWKPCDPVPDTNYDGGGVQIKTVKATACFTPAIYRIITRSNGTNEFVAALAYGGGSHEKVRTVRNTNCWSQNVAVGTYMAVYVTCQEYTGWVAAKITTAGKFTMKPVGWEFEPKWM